LAADANPFAGIADAGPLAKPAPITAARARPLNFHIAIVALHFLGSPPRLKISIWPM
jgi:hypothetical protein